MIDIKEVTFSGMLRYTDEGHLYMDNSPDGIEYFGPPSERIDQAWDNLIHGIDSYSMNEALSWITNRSVLTHGCGLGSNLVEISAAEAETTSSESDAHPISGHRMAYVC